MVNAGFGCDAELGAKKGGAEFGNQFFHRIGIIAEALAELAIAALFVRGPVSLMRLPDYAAPTCVPVDR
jgi:hypothetical protein